MHAFEIVHFVQDKFKGLPGKVAEIAGKTESWWASHGRKPKTEDAIANGNVSPVTHYVRYCKIYEAATPGAGVMLSQLVHAELCSAFNSETEDCPQRELRRNILKEAAETVCALDESEIKEMRLPDLKRCNLEISELIQVSEKAQNQVMRQIRRREISEKLGLVGLNGRAK